MELHIAGRKPCGFFLYGCRTIDALFDKIILEDGDVADASFRNLSFWMDGAVYVVRRDNAITSNADVYMQKLRTLPFQQRLFENLKTLKVDENIGVYAALDR